MTTTYRLAVINGDGIGPEVTGEALKVMRAAGELFGFALAETHLQLGAERYLASQHVIDDDDLTTLGGHDAILFGAIGDPRVAPGVLERGLILHLRSMLKQAVNLRPVRLYPGVISPVRDVSSDNCDLVILRENSEGMYTSGGSTLSTGGRSTVAVQESINTRATVERLVDFAFRLASSRRGRLTLCHKTNVLVHAGALYSDVMQETAVRYPDIETDYVHVDAMCQHLPLTPGRFDVVVTDNLFGDIISDLGATIQGGLGVACSANLNIAGDAPSMFEPVHGSAPDIAGKGWANPAGAILSAALALSWLGEPTAAQALEAATAGVLADLPALAGPGMGMSTVQIGDRVVEVLHAATAHQQPQALPRSVMAAIHDLREVRS